MDRKLFFILFLVLVQFVSADIISVNSGGNNQLCMTSGGDIETCFFCVPTTCAELGYNCDTWNDGCGGTFNCGTCANICPEAFELDLKTIKFEGNDVPIVLRQSDRNGAIVLAEELKSMILDGKFPLKKPTGILEFAESVK